MMTIPTLGTRPRYPRLVVADKLRVAYARLVDCEVRFLPSKRRVRVPSGTTLLDAVRRASLPVASACGAEALCGRCGLTVLSGDGALAAETREERSAKQRNRVDPALRLGCRTRVVADLKVTAPYW